MSHTVERKTLRSGFTVEVIIDEDAENPAQTRTNRASGATGTYVQKRTTS